MHCGGGGVGCDLGAAEPLDGRPKFVTALHLHLPLGRLISQAATALSQAAMASAASMPAYMLPGVPVHQPSHLEGDATLATEILPGPPSLVSAQQSAQKRDPRRPTTNFSYLPPSDPGSTYSGLMHGTLVGQELEGARIKRTRVEKRWRPFIPSC